MKSEEKCSKSLRRSSKCSEIPVISLGSLRVIVLEKIKHYFYLFEGKPYDVWKNLQKNYNNPNNSSSK